MAVKAQPGWQGSDAFAAEMSVFLRRVLYGGALIAVIFTIFIMLGVFRIGSNAVYTYNQVDDIPYRRVGLLLGTAPYTSSGRPNEFFTNRIAAAVSLYQHGKIDYILVSGDNRHKSYNEPREMMRALIRAGVPRSRIAADFAGFSTIDSVIRAKRVFMQNEITVISQSFHNERAIFIARNHDLNAIGFNAPDPSAPLSNFKVQVREFFALIKCVIDVYILNSQPTYLGTPVAIGDAPLPKEPTNQPKTLTSMPKALSNTAKMNQITAYIEARRAKAKPLSDSAYIMHQQQLAQKMAAEAASRAEALSRQPQSRPAARPYRTFGDPWE